MILHTVDPRSGWPRGRWSSTSPSRTASFPGKLTDVIALYERAGYRCIARYNDNPHAQVWFEKSLITQPVWGTRVGS
jgi:hypothetical protein